jgi:aminotransferase
VGLSLSRRAARIAKAEIRNMTVECERIGGINLAQGVCDLPVPPPVADGAVDAIHGGENAYTRHDGIARLRRAIAGKMQAYNRITADPETEVVVSAGSTGALYCTVYALLDPGDEVIVFEPYYGYHVNTLLAVDAVPVFVPMRAPDWSYDLDEVRRAITPKTRAILLNTPGNPTGKVYSRDELTGLARLAAERDLFVFTDEMYEYFLYDGTEHVSIGALPEAKDRTITISGYSKTFNITGWRIGYAIADARWAEMIGYVNDLVYVCAPAPLQAGVAAGIERLGPDYYAGLITEFRGKREKLCSALREAGFGLADPRGAYYVLADASHIPGTDSKAKALRLLRDARVASVPGGAFFHDEAGEKFLRFCFAKENDELERAAERLRTFSESLIANP